METLEDVLAALHCYFKLEVPQETDYIPDRYEFDCDKISLDVIKADY